MHSLPIIKIPHQNGTFVTTDNLYWHIIIIQVHSLHEGSLLVLHIQWVWKCMLTCIHHYGIIQSSFHSPKVLCTLLSHPFLSQSVYSLFILLIVSLTEQEFLIVMKSSLSVLPFMDHAFRVYLKSHHQTQGKLDFLLCHLRVL